MAVWKQILFLLVILAVAAAGWMSFAPGAPDLLARWGVERGDEITGATPQGASSPQTAVVTAAVNTATINDRLTAIGTGRANASVAVNPFVAGRMVELAVSSGARVEAGTVIARLDSEVEEIAVERATIELNDARAKLERAKTLRSSNAATAVQVTDAELALENARLALRDAELTRDRRSITAPISGIVGILPIEAGNYITTQTTIATIDDRSQIIVDFWVPERFANIVAVGTPLTASLVAQPGMSFQGSVSAVDNRLDEQSRTLRVQARLDNRDDMLRAGMSFLITMRFPGETYPSVDPLAIQWGTDGAFVWAIHDGKARRVTVRIIQRNTESVLVEADIAAGDVVVTEGVHVVREGAEPLIAKADSRSGAALDDVLPANAASGS